MRSVRVRLLALALLPMVAVLPIVLGCALFWWLAEYYAAVVTLAAIVLWLR